MNAKISRAAWGVALTSAMAGTAVAADPESGTVSASSPKVSWTGSTTGSYAARLAAAQSDEFPCRAPTCDAFALKVETSSTLTLGVSVDGGETSIVTTRVHKPDGSVVKADSPAGGAVDGKVFKVVIKNAPTGDYTIDHFNNAPAQRNNESFAELAIAGAPAAPPPGGTGPQPPSQPGPSVQAIDLKVSVRKASARKLEKSKKLAAKVTVSREVESITATLRKGSKTVGKGKLGKTSGTKKLTVKTAKKLKRGTYALTVVATDGKTSTTKTVKVKVGK